ncbi:MAG TPA: substrate-binding domain-containing protein [Solirubrobacteraceae bacterium]|jgi:ribose transport system substrate-binding protein
MIDHSTLRQRRRTLRYAIAASLAGVAALATAFGLPAASSGATVRSAAAAACGVVPNVGPGSDPQHLVNALPAAQQAGYNGFPNRIYPSAYAHFKSKHKAPYTLGFIDNDTGNAYNASLLADMKVWAAKLEKKGLVKNLISYVTPGFSAATQIQQFHSLIEQKVDAIIVEPADAPALVPSVQAAEKAGIPTISWFGSIDSPDAVNPGINVFLNGAEPVAYEAQHFLHGKGNMLVVRGAPTQAADVYGYQGAKAVLAHCPNIHVVGSVIGQYENSVAKSVTLQFLSSYHGTINGEYDSGTMTQGILSAFQQLGRPLPAMTNLGAVDGVLAYARSHPSFHTVGTATGALDSTRLITNVALRVLLGQGPKMNDIVLKPVLVTPANLDQFVKAGTSVNDLDSAENPPFSLASNATLNGWFTKGSNPAPGTL